MSGASRDSGGGDCYYNHLVTVVRAVVCNTLNKSCFRQKSSPLRCICGKLPTCDLFCYKYI